MLFDGEYELFVFQRTRYFDLGFKKDVKGPPPNYTIILT